MERFVDKKYTQERREGKPEPQTRPVQNKHKQQGI